MVEAMGAANRLMFINLLGQEWLRQVPDVHARLQADPPARVADVGCGTGWSSVAIARAYPKVHVDGFDLDATSIEIAQANAAQAGLNDRVNFHVRDAADPALAGQYELVTAFETLHDMARPVEALRAMRSLAVDGAAVIVADERVGEMFASPGTDVERLNYGFSVLHCLTVGMADHPSAATGTVLRLPMLRWYASEAGFRGVSVLPIDHDFWQFYRLLP
jgi:SAM-dependent methyltransferase